MLTMNRINPILPLVAREPWSLMAAVGAHILKDFEEGVNETVSSVGTAQSESAMLFELDVPGKNVADIDVSLEGRLLAVEVNAPVAIEGQPRRTERSTQHVALKWKLPFEPDAEKTEVTYEHGVLRIVIHRAPASVRRKLEIQH